MALKHIDQDTVYPNGKRGLPGRPAIAIVNENTAETEVRLSALEGGSGGVSAALDLLGQGQSALQSGLAGEAQARAALDAALDARIDAEQIARQAADAALGLRIPGKNALINGNFDFAQRGTSGNYSVTTEAYTVDRWVCGFVNIVGNWGVGGQAISSPVGARRFLGFNVASLRDTPASCAAYIGQKIERVDTLAGKRVTLSVWARSTPVGKKLAARCIQVFGTGGSPSTTVQIESAQVHTLTANFARYSFVIDLPSVAGKTLGSAGNDCLFVVLDYCNGSQYGGQLIGQLGLFEVAQAQLEEGAAATSFDFRPLALELSLCQRYYCKTYSLDTPPGTPNTDPGRIASGSMFPSVGAASFNAYGARLPVQMRAQPAVTVYGAVSGNPGWVTGSDNNNAGPVTIRGVNTSGFEVNWANNAGTFGGWFHYTADAEV